MAPAYKLTYFNGRGLAETSRYLLKYGGIDFEDVRVEHADWPQLKDSQYNEFSPRICNDR
jgi:glutathione S-transferase